MQMHPNMPSFRQHTIGRKTSRDASKRNGSTYVNMLWIQTVEMGGYISTCPSTFVTFMNCLFFESWRVAELDTIIWWCGYKYPTYNPYVRMGGENKKKCVGRLEYKYEKDPPYPEPVYTGWSRVHWNATGMPLVDPVYTGTPLEKLSWNSPTLECHCRNLVESTPHWDATGETLTFTAYTGTPLEGLWQPTHAPRIWFSIQSSIHASLKWQDGGTPVSKWIGLCIFSLYLEFTALQWMPVLLFTYVSTSTLLCAWLGYEHRYSFCVFGVTSQMKSV